MNRMGCVPPSRAWLFRASQVRFVVARRTPGFTGALSLRPALCAPAHELGTQVWSAELCVRPKNLVDDPSGTWRRQRSGYLSYSRRRLTVRLKLTADISRLNDAVKAPAFSRGRALAGPQLNRRFVRPLEDQSSPLLSYCEATSRFMWILRAVVDPAEFAASKYQRDFLVLPERCVTWR